jgi:hypothetical protein
MFVILLLPHEVASSVPDWPGDLVILITQHSDGTATWDACLEGMAEQMIGIIPLWPPRPGFAVAALDARIEVPLVHSVLSLPGLLELAQKRLPVPNKENFAEILHSDIDWG